MSFPRNGTRLCFVLECYNLLPASARMVRTEIVRRGMTWASMKQARRGPAASSHTAQGGPAWTRGLRAAIRRELPPCANLHRASVARSDATYPSLESPLPLALDAAAGG